MLTSRISWLNFENLSVLSVFFPAVLRDDFDNFMKLDLLNRYHFHCHFSGGLVGNCFKIQALNH